MNVNDASIPINGPEAIASIRAAFSAWDGVQGPADDYFTVNRTGGAARPDLDGNNTVGWVKIVPRSVLGATWAWADADTGEIVEADFFYNAFHKWDVFSVCDEQDKYEVGDVGTHEVGHMLGLDHLSDANAYATRYPTASKGEVRKQTLTDADKQGYKDAGGY